MKNLNLFFALGTCIFMYSCGTTDSDAPTFCSVADDVADMDEVEANAGDTLTLNQTVCDNDALGTANWDIHSAEGHAHEGEEEEGFVLFSGTWDDDISDGLTGTSDVSSVSTIIPNDVRGVWDIVISLVDAEGNIAADVVTPLHIENDYIPEFTLTTVTGLDLSEGGEPEWSLGQEITIEGSVSDSNGIEEYGIHLEHEDSDYALDICDFDLDAPYPASDSFDQVFLIPNDAPSGEYHVHMHAHDGEGTHMETGFHVEIE